MKNHLNIQNFIMLSHITSKINRCDSNFLKYFSSTVSSHIIGIDLGTTNSCVSVIEGNQKIVIPNNEGSNTTPSIVAFDKNNNVLVGELAKHQAVTNVKNTFFATKRLIGRKFNDEQVNVCKKSVAYEITEHSNGEAWLKDQSGKTYSPSQIAGYILRKMKDTAETYLGEKIKDAIVTVPAYFNNAQRQATKDAGQIAGLNVLRTINEPTAAALAYGIDRQKQQTIAVFDLGGGTFDISILEISDDGVFEVKSTNGDTFLGGEDFDNVIANYIISEFMKKENVDVSKDPIALQRVREAAEKAKILLSSNVLTEINLPYLYTGIGGPKHFSIPFSRAQMNNLTRPLIQKTLDPCVQALKDAEKRISDINEVILVGGMTKMPAVVDAVKQFFNKEPFGDVNPDECVSIGAAIQGSVLTSRNSILLLDVTPLSLGIEAMGGVFSKVIPRNTVIPTKKTENFSTAVDGQTNVAIRVYQGERELVKDNKLLGEFNLVGIKPQQRGEPDIEVTFEIDANSIVHVSAKDLASGKEQKIEISNSGGLSQDEIARMIEDAEKHSEDDKKKRESIEYTYDIHGFISEIEKQIALNKDRLPTSVVKNVEKYIEKMHKAFETLDSEVIDKAFNALNKAAMELPKHI